MTHSRIMNLKTGLTMCHTCGAQYSWDIQCCPFCAKRREAAQQALAAAARETGVTAEWLTAAQVAQLADMSADLRDCPKDWRDLRGDCDA